VYDYICRLSYELKPGFQPYARTHATQATYATYHVTNSSHVIGYFLRWLRCLRRTGNRASGHAKIFVERNKNSSRKFVWNGNKNQ